MSAASGAPLNLSADLRNKTVRVLTKNGFSMRGRVVDFDADHMNIVLDCLDAAVGVTGGVAAADPPHIGPWHREVFVRGSSIRWIEVDGHSIGV